jgi:hypothetical protein
MTSLCRAGRLLPALTLVSSAASGQKKGEVAVWLTNPDKSALFERQREVTRTTEGARCAREPSPSTATSGHAQDAALGKGRLKAGCSQDWLPHNRRII